ncbi:thioredoxin-disulfide reductase [Sinorhizobium meliloti]|uniref:thioredoxin-disulfide reductase n=1 Tax=Rhizobium meliloti TaxID=382 RepID=UPI000FD49B9A|nr:thioredoxin-disulfide reductase [Sinorhizobium meliloti]RVE80778.1 thioredoxin-disulfide reductase [Sinorhizobium meliloti]RVE99328.1 thioredoxin-disulfide reductase [Sinorhizobium meliloti]RVM94124.1 thioredoxin-disulfide reductase [Sinorhizobium meliloti]
MNTHHTRVLIIGAGPAGYTAAIYAARANLKPLLVTGPRAGGQLTIATEVENYPGFAEPVQGPWLMEQMRLQAENVGTKVMYDIITSVDLSKRPFHLKGDSGDTYIADALIIATGAQARWLGLPSEEKFNGLGVFACASCDGFFYRNKEVVVVGGGNIAVQEALHLSSLASKVTVVHRQDCFRAEPILRDRLLARPNVEVVWKHVLDEVVGECEPRNWVTGVRIRDVNTGDVRELPTNGLFVAIGHDPATALFRGQLDMDRAGYIKVGSWSTKTSVPGVLAAGDVIDPVFRRAISAAGTGSMAALEAAKFLAEPVETREIEIIGVYG